MGMFTGRHFQSGEHRGGGFDSGSLRSEVERTSIARLPPMARGRTLPIPANTWSGTGSMRGSIWRISTPRSGRCGAGSHRQCRGVRRQRRHGTGTAAEPAGKQQYLCPALILTGPTIRVRASRLMRTRAGLRPEIPELCLTTTSLSRRPADAWLFGWQARVGANPCRLLRRPAGPACRRGRSALGCSC